VVGRWPLPGPAEVPPMPFYRLTYGREAPLHDVEGALRRALEALAPLAGRIGIPVGSRGIPALAEVLEALLGLLRKAGGDPVLVPAMGSHGGGTADGRRQVLSELGLLRSRWPWSFDEQPVEVARWEGHPLFWPKALAEADVVLPVNRVKPHPSFDGEVGSGCAKMLVVGMGGPSGARLFHAAPASSLGERLLGMAGALLATGRVAGGIALLEGSGKGLLEIRALRATTFLDDERRALARAAALLPRLPFSDLDVLIVAEVGKNIAGTGVDTRLVGRTGVSGLAYRDAPTVRRIIGLSLTPESHGNANGMGLLDFVPASFARAVDLVPTYLNALTTGFLDRARLPLVLPTERECLAAALFSLNPPTDRPRIAVIRNTSDLATLHATKGALDAALRRPAEVEGPFELSLDPLAFTGG